jgi:uncharacterized protein
MINRQEALVLIKKYLKNTNLFKYSLSVEAILRDLAKRLNKDEELWGLTGLLHNLDYEYTTADFEKRGSISAQLLDGLIPEIGINAILANNYMHTSAIPSTSLDKALIASDAITELIFTIKKKDCLQNLQQLNFSYLEKKFKDTSFAENISRSKIKLCIDIGINIDDFLIISLDSLKSISRQIDI